MPCIIGSDSLNFLLQCLGDNCPLAIKLAAIECLIVLFSRNFSPTSATLRDELLWVPLFNNGKIQFIFQLYLNIYGVADLAGLKAAQHVVELDDDVYKLLKRFAQVSIDF